MWPNPQFPADLFIFTGEILNGKLHFLCSDSLRMKAIRKKTSLLKTCCYTVDTCFTSGSGFEKVINQSFSENLRNFIFVRSLISSFFLYKPQCVIDFLYTNIYSGTSDKFVGWHANDPKEF